MYIILKLIYFLDLTFMYPNYSRATFFLQQITKIKIKYIRWIKWLIVDVTRKLFVQT